MVLESFDAAKKIGLLKALRGITSLGLNETKAFVDALPKAVKTGISKDDAAQVCTCSRCYDIACGVRLLAWTCDRSLSLMASPALSWWTMLPVAQFVVVHRC